MEYKRHARFLSLALDHDPKKRLNGWKNHITDKYDPGPLALANPPSALFPQNKSAFRLYDALIEEGYQPIEAALITMLEYRYSQNDFNPIVFFEYESWDGADQESRNPWAQRWVSINHNR